MLEVHLCFDENSFIALCNAAGCEKLECTMKLDLLHIKNELNQLVLTSAHLLLQVGRHFDNKRSQALVFLLYLKNLKIR